MSFFSSSRWDNWTIYLIMNTFANVWSLTNIRCPFSLHPDKTIEKFPWRWTHSQSLIIDKTCNVLFLFIKIRSMNNFLTMNTFANVWSFTNIRCPFSRHPHQMIQQLLLRWTHPPMFRNWTTSDVLFICMEIRSLNNVSYHHNIRQCLIIDQHPMSFFSASRWDHWTIFLKMSTFANVRSFTNIRFPFSPHRDQITQQFLLARWHSPMFDHWPTFDVLFLLMEMRSLNNICYHHNIRQCSIIDQHPMPFF